MPYQWNDSGTELSFETKELRGVLVADCGSHTPHHCRHRIRELVHKQTGDRVSPKGGVTDDTGSFTLFRTYARDA